MTTKKQAYAKGSDWDTSRDPEAVYEYHDPKGGYLYEGQRQGRGEAKAFRYGRTNHLPFGERLEKEDHWNWKDGSGGLPAVLYGLPEIIAADPSTPVFITEGERDKDLLAELGLIATTNPFGAFAWMQEHGGFLADRHCIICEDNDEAGAKRTQLILKTLGRAASVSLVRFRDKPKGYDVGDFLDDGNSLEDLMARVETTLPIVTGNLSDTVDAIEECLLKTPGVEIFGRMGNLVRPITTAESESLLIAINANDLRDIISAHCEFLKYNAKGDLVPASATLDFAATLLARVGRWKFPEVTGLHQSPIVRDDGSVIDQPGYDPTTGLYLVLPKEKVDIGTTRAEAEIAVRALCELLAEFPVVSKTDLSVLLSGLLIPLARPSINAAPMTTVRANDAGSGKSYYLDTVSMLALGTKSETLTLVEDDDDENRKLLSSLAIRGTPLLCCDNVNWELRGDFIAQLIERPSVSPRILGRSEAAKIKNIFSVYADGINIAISGDLTRRVLLANLDAKMERPETRQFKGDPVAAIEANRSVWLGHGLTIIRAYLTHIKTNPRQKVKAFNSFEAYSKLVREPLQWLGFADPCDSIEDIRRDDPKRNALQALIAAWPQDQQHYTASQLIAASSQPNAKGILTQDNPLGRALETVASDGRGQINKLKLAKYLSSKRNMIADQKFIDMSFDSHSKTNVFSLMMNDNNQKLDAAA